MAEIARNYKAETGVPVRLQLGGSGALEAQLEVAGGDLFLSADGSYLESVRKKGLLGNSFPVARGAVDATIAWDSVARGFSEVEWIEVPAFSERPVDSGIGVLLS